MPPRYTGPAGLLFRIFPRRSGTYGVWCEDNRGASNGEQYLMAAGRSRHDPLRARASAHFANFASNTLPR